MPKIITYDTIVVQQGQYLMDIALQYYGTTEPPAMLALVEDNKLSGITDTINPGDILYVRKDADWKLNNVVNYYKTNNIIPATAVAPPPPDNTIDIVDVMEEYDHQFAWNDNILSFTSVGWASFLLRLEEIISPGSSVLLEINSNYPFTCQIYLLYNVDTMVGYQDVTNIEVTIQAQYESNTIIFSLFYLPINIDYQIKIIAKRP